MHVPDPRNLAAALLAGLALTVSAQDANTDSNSPRLVELRQNFENGFRRDITPASRQYGIELQRLEKKYAESGDLESAIQARDERLALQAFLGDLLTADPIPPAVPATTPGDQPIKPDAEGAIALPSTAANISGGAKFTDDGLDLSAKGATARWSLAGLEPGGFEIELNYTATSGGKIRVGESFFRITDDLPATGIDSSCLSLGTLKITRESKSIYVTNLGLRSGSGKILLDSLVLLSAKD